SQSDAKDSNQYDHSESLTMVNTKGQILSTSSLLQKPTNIAPETPKDTNLNKKQASKNKKITSTKEIFQNIKKIIKRRQPKRFTEVGNLIVEQDNPSIEEIRVNPFMIQEEENKDRNK
ncbi:34087_t:CDS:2, partial [Gigaspora margarita]